MVVHGLTDEALKHVTFPYQKYANQKIIFTINLYAAWSGLNKCTKLPSFIENDILDKLIKLSQYIDVNDEIQSRFTVTRGIIFSTNKFDTNDLIKNFYINRTLPISASDVKKLVNKNGNQISALVQQENYYYKSNGQIDYTRPVEISTYILPRYTFDDLMHWELYFDRTNYGQGVSNIYGSCCLTTMPNKPYKVLCEDISQTPLKQFDHEKHIKEFNKDNKYSAFGPKYVEGTYNENEVYTISGLYPQSIEYGKIYEQISGTYIMEFQDLNGLQTTLVKYTFKNNLPIRSLKCLYKNRTDTLTDLKNNTSIHSNKYEVINNLPSIFRNIYHTYGFGGLPCLSPEERYRAIIDTDTSNLGRLFGWNPYYLYPKPNKISSNKYTVQGTNNKKNSITAYNNIELLYDYAYNSGNYMSYNPDYIDFYYQSTKTPNYIPITAGLDISMVPIIALSGYNYKEGINNNINPPISKYLSNMILDKNGYTRGLPYLYDIHYEKFKLKFDLSQSVGLSIASTSAAYISGYYPSTYIMPNSYEDTIAFAYFNESLNSKCLSYAEDDVVIPSTISQITRGFISTRGEYFNGNYKFLKFDKATKLRDISYFYSSNTTIVRR